MNTYHKIHSVFKREENGSRGKRKLILGEWSLPEFEYLKNNDWIFTEKIDGTNIRIMWYGESIKFGGKTDNADIPTFLLAKLHVMFYDKELLFTELFGNKPACIYGEGYGNRIQSVGSKYIPDDVSFIAFDVKIGNYWLPRSEVETICDGLGIDIVPIIAVCELEDMIDYVSHNTAPCSRIGTAPVEGYVGVPAVKLHSDNGRVIVKIKYVDF